MVLIHSACARLRGTASVGRHRLPIGGRLCEEVAGLSAAEPRTGARGARSRFERAEWILLAIALINSTGSGAFAAGSVVFFTRYVGFSPARVGGALSAAALVGMVMTVPTGLVAERFGARRTLIVLHLLRTIGYSAYALVQSFPLFVGLTVLLTVMDRAATPATQAVVAGTMRAEDRVRIMSWRYAMANVGLGLGSALVAVVLAFGSRVGFQALLVFNGATFAAGGVARLQLSAADRGDYGLAAVRGCSDRGAARVDHHSHSRPGCHGRHPVYGQHPPDRGAASADQPARP
jgi:predicted MFS family arabinose efflux permease